MKNEKKFYDKLNDVFIGAKIEGKGGFVNLMKVKSNYYKKISVKLKHDIDERLQGYEDFKEDMFIHLYNFFDRYFTESGSIYFDRTAYQNSVYEKVYTDEKDVILFWKTHMLYYVKTDRIFKSLPVEFDGFKFYFDSSKVDNKKANEKRSLIYSFKEIKADDTIVFIVEYSERGRITKIEDILKNLNRGNIKISENKLERAFKIFEKQSEVDFFINKNANDFLKEQFKLWQYQFMFDEKDIWEEKSIKKLQFIKETAYDIIDYVSQFEDELIMIWNKPKFVRKSNYVITLDKIAAEQEGMNIIKKLIFHSGIRDQTDEWKDLGIVGDNFNIGNLLNHEKNEETLKKTYEKLPIDTKYFKDIELEILGLFDNLDKSLDGRIIKSENYQALNTIKNKFKGQVQTIFIDPPFNLDSSDQFLYRTNYKDSNWATMLENRISLSKEYLDEKGGIFVRCDYNGNWIVKCLMDNIFLNDNFKNEISLNRFQKKSVYFTTTTESLFFYSKSNKLKFNSILKSRQCIYCKRDIEGKWQWSHSAGGSKIPKYFLVNGKKVLLYPPRGRHWTNSQLKIDELTKNNQIRINFDLSYIDCNGKRINYIPERLQDSEVYVDNNWTDIPGYVFGVYSDEKFSTQNSDEVLERVINSTSDVGDLCFDFFLGSGTTVSVSHKLKRRWLGVELGEQFHTAILPRMKRVFANKETNSLVVSDFEGGGFFKYYELEQYEDTLKNCKYEDGDVFGRLEEKPYNGYVFLKDKKMLDAIEIDYKNNEVNVDLSKLYDDIDIAETLSNLTGKWIKKITENEVEFEDGEKINTKKLNYKLIKPLIWWERGK